MKVLMVGASGKDAGMVLPELKKRGATVRALIAGGGQGGS
jgi:putative NADH-flavin reductase